MKKFFLFTYAIILVVFPNSCTKTEDTDSVNIPSMCTIYYGEKFQLNTYQEWKSSKPFVATVDGSGTIVANHAGDCKIYCSKGSCSVSVIPTMSLYNEPICEADLTPNKITNKYGTPDYWDYESGYMVYETGSSSIPYIYFEFNKDNGWFKGAVVIVKKDLHNQLCEHLNQRYARQDANYYIWADDYTNSYSITKYVGIGEAIIPLIGDYGRGMVFDNFYGVWYEPANSQHNGKRVNILPQKN